MPVEATVTGSSSVASFPPLFGPGDRAVFFGGAAFAFPAVPGSQKQHRIRALRARSTLICRLRSGAAARSAD
jgi:hypothetical protein